MAVPDSVPDTAPLPGAHSPSNDSDGMRTAPVGERVTEHFPAVSRRARKPAARLELCKTSALDVLNLPRGTVLADRYVVLEKVGRGGMGVVYRALDKRREETGSNNATVALKFACAARGDEGLAARLLESEFSRVLDLRHENVVHAYSFERHGPHYFFVMEWLSGATLAASSERLRDEDPGFAATAIRSLASALAYAHGRGVTHADVKPANVFVTESGAVTLLDFGNLYHAVSDTAEHGARRWTTRSYASSEVLEGNAPTPADDVYSLGVLAYELLSGQRPYGEHTACEAETLALEPAPLPLVDPALASAIMQSIRLRAAQRFETAAGFLDRITPRPRGDTEPLVMPARTPRRWLAPLAAAAGLAGGWLAAQQFVAATPPPTVRTAAAPVAVAPVPTPPAPANAPSVPAIDGAIEPVPPPNAMPSDARQPLIPAPMRPAVVTVAPERPVPALPMIEPQLTAPRIERRANVLPARIATASVNETPRAFDATSGAASAPERSVSRRTPARATAVTTGEDSAGSSVQPGRNEARPTPRGSHWLEASRRQPPVAPSALRFRRYVQPRYPRRNGHSGWAEVGFVVAPTGQPVGIQILRSEPDDSFNQATLSAVAQWQFAPADGGRHVVARLRFEPGAR